MDIEKRSTGFGAAIILFSVFLRLCSGILPQPAHSLRLPASRAEATLFARGGGKALSAPTLPPETVPPTTLPPQKPQIPCFTSADMDLVRLRYATDCSRRADLEALLTRPLSWQLDGEEPTVLILHSHTCESYTLLPGQQDENWNQYRTQTEAYNMVAVGAYLTQLLEAGGIRVLHDSKIHDDPYNQAYTNSRQTAQQYLQQYPSIQIVIDLHRDSAENPDGSQFRTQVSVDGAKIAQVMLVMGSHTTALPHPMWQDNLSVALKLQVLMEKQAPGITRTTVLRGQRFNQDLVPGGMIVEVGSAGNTLQEALGAMPFLADAILALMHGADGA